METRNISLILGVVQSDLQLCIDILSEGGDPNIRTRDGTPLLHAAISLEDDEQALALTQLLLVHGADPGISDQGVSAVNLADNLQRRVILDQLLAFGATTRDAAVSPGVSRKFQSYIFKDSDDTSPGNKFLEKVASLFEDNIKGVSEDTPRIQDDNIDNDIGFLASQLKSVKTLSSATFLCPPKHEHVLRSPSRHHHHRVCSTPLRSHPPSLNVSLISSVGAAGDNDLNCTITSIKNSVSNNSTMNSIKSSVSNRSTSNSSCDMFQSCLSNTESNLSFSQQYLVEDPDERISFIEERHSSVLSVRNISVQNDDSSSNDSNITIVNNTVIVNNTIKSSLSVSLSDFNHYPEPLAESLVNVCTVTKKWKYLSKLELDMSDKFSNLSSSTTNLVNQLTRETACKSSFNYLLLDPGVTRNLPMRVFSDSDQEQ